jgi:PKD repeat protein
VSLTVTSAADGSTSTAQQTVSVIVPPTATPTTEPVQAAFTFNAAADNPLAVQFTNLSTGPAASFFWNFGDGFSTSTEQNPQMVYSAGGDYNVTLTVTSIDGSTSTAQQIVSVVAPPTATPPPEPVNAAFTFNVDPANPLTVQFIDQSSGPVAGYQWNFGDGVSVSNEQNPVFTYAAGGDYGVTLTVTSAADGSTSIAQQTVSVVQPTPVPEPVNADFTFLTAPENPLTVQFTSLATGPVGSYFWDFGDGVSTSTEQNPVFTYAAGGEYVVTHTVTSAADGSTSSTQQTVPVLEPLMAAFSAVVMPDNPLGVTFTNESSGPAGTAFQWNFGDGVGFSSDENPSYIYAAPGTYDVTLTISAPDRLTTDVLTQQVTVEAPPMPRTAELPAPQFALTGTARAVYSLAYNPTFSLLATGNDDGSVTVWDLNSRSPLQTLNNQTDVITAVSWSPDGSRLASASLDGTVVVVETASWTPVFTLPLDAGVSAVAYSPNGTLIAASTLNGVIQFWDSAGNPISSVTAADRINWFAWRPDGTQIAYTGREQAAVIFDVATGTVLANIPLGNVGTTVAWNPAGTQLLAGTTDGASVFDPTSGIPLFPIQNAADALTGAWSPNGAQIAVGTSAGEIILTDNAGNPVTTFPAPGEVTGIAWNANNGQLAASNDDGSVQVWQP